MPRSQTPNNTQPPGGIHLEPLQAEILEKEARALGASLPDPALRAQCEALAEAATHGSIPDNLARPLEMVLELLNTTQRVRREHGHDADEALKDLYRLTPTGISKSVSARETNKALKALAGQTIESLTVSTSPGGYTLNVLTDRVRLALEVNRSGASIQSLEVGG